MVRRKSMGGEVEIRIRFSGRHQFPCGLVGDLMEIVDSAVFQSQVNDLEIAYRELDIDPVVMDAARYRIRDYRGSAYLVEDIRKGSLVVVGVAAGLAYWVLQNTIGESFKEAWKETGSHKRIKDFFLSKRRGKAFEICDEVNRQFPRGRRFLRDRAIDIEARVLRDEDNDSKIQPYINHEVVEIEVTARKDREIPLTYGDMEAGRRDER